MSVMLVDVCNALEGPPGYCLGVGMGIILDILGALLRCIGGGGAACPKCVAARGLVPVL